MSIFKALILSILFCITPILSAPPPPRSKFVNPFYKTPTTGGPSTSAPRLPASLLDLFLPPQPASKIKSASNPADQSIMDLPGLAPAMPSTVTKQLPSPLLGGLDFTQLTRLCETMAAANRAKKMSDAVRVAAAQPKDLIGWIELIRQAEPIPFETFACQMLERLMINPDEFVADLLRLFMPASATSNIFQQQFPQFNLPQAGQNFQPQPNQNLQSQGNSISKMGLIPVPTPTPTPMPLLTTAAFLEPRKTDTTPMSHTVTVSDGKFNRTVKV